MVTLAPSKVPSALLGCGEIKSTDSAWQTRIEPVSSEGFAVEDDVAMRDHALFG
jgi:hypothetical protein